MYESANQDRDYIMIHTVFSLCPDMSDNNPTPRDVESLKSLLYSLLAIQPPNSVAMNVILG